MLIQNSRILETHCPRSWTAGTTIAAIILVLVTATFGGKSGVGAADEREPAVASKGDAQKTADGKSKGANAAILPENDKAPGAEKPDTEKQKLLDGLFARATAIKSGRFITSTQSIVNGKPGAAEHADFIVSGESWVERSGRPRENVVAVNHAGRFLTYRRREGMRRDFVLTVDWPRPVPAGPSAPLHAGTIWDPRTLHYLREHAAAARVRGRATINEIETKVVEWNVPAVDTSAGFQSSNRGLLSGGGTYRVFVAPQLGYAVPRIEYVDRFGTPQFVIDISGFTEVAARIHFPDTIRIQEGEREQTIDVTAVVNVNEPIDESAFALRVPAATPIEDKRPHRYDKVDADGKRSYSPYVHTLREFTTGAEYPDGLPAAMLEEMDREVISREEIEKEEIEKTRAAQAAAEEAIGELPEAVPGQPPAPGKSIKRSYAGKPTTYGGKYFEEWRDVLLRDVEPDTRVKALTAVGAFAANGYPEEAAAAIGEALKNDDRTLKGGKVQEAACAALERCGAAGVPVLAGQLQSESLESRVNAVNALANLAASTDATVPTLVAAAKDSAVVPRRIAIRALATHRLTTAGVDDVLKAVLRDDESVRLSMVQGLSNSKAADDEIVELISRLLTDDNATVRAIAAAVFAARAPATLENARALQSAVLDGGSQARKSFVEQLREQQRRGGIRLELTVPILTALLKSEDSYRDLRGYEIVFAEMIFEMIDKMPQDNAAAQAAIPVLIKAVEEELPIGNRGRATRPARIAPLPPVNGKDPEERLLSQPRLVLAAAESLGRFGTLATEALPALRGLLEPGRISHDQLQHVNLETEKQWQSRIESVIHKIESKPDAPEADTAKVSVGDFSISNTTAAPGSKIHVDFKLAVVTSSKDGSTLEERIKTNTANIREALNRIIRSAKLEELKDPELGTIKQLIRDDLNRLLRKSYVNRVVITDVRIVEQ